MFQHNKCAVLQAHAASADVRARVLIPLPEVPRLAHESAARVRRPARRRPERGQGRYVLPEYVDPRVVAQSEGREGT